MMRDTIDGLTISWDEDGAHLIFSGEEREYNLRVSSLHVAKEVADVIREGLGSWVAEAHAAIPAGGIFRCNPEDDLERDLLDPEDPKHPDYADRLASIWDNREKV